MRTTIKRGLTAAVVCLFVAASVIPVDAQRARSRPPSGGGQGASSPPPRSGTAVPRGTQQARPARPANQPAQGPAAGRPGGPRPGGPGYPGRGPAYGPGYRPYPGYGYGSRWYGPSVYWGFSGFYGPYVYSPWYWSPYWYYPSYGYGYGYGGGYDSASLKVNVKPKDAEVYIDGHLAGIVDQYDGMFQSLSVESGGHEVTIYRDGYRSIRQSIYLAVGSTFRIKGEMEELAPGEPNEPRPQTALDPQFMARPPGPEPPDSYPDQAPPPQRAERGGSPAPAGDARFGQVAIRVQPGDAQVMIDGEAWRSAPGSDRLVVHLSPGTHRIEIRKDGFDPFVTAVEIIRGETAVLNVSLTRF